jgi:hypothetical protein
VGEMDALGSHGRVRCACGSVRCRSDAWFGQDRALARQSLIDMDTSLMHGINRLYRSEEGLHDCICAWI